MNASDQCLNCESKLPTDAKFCHQCGQSTAIYDKPIRPILSEMLHESLDIDGRVILTLKTLLFKPGLLSLEYKNGRRHAYTPPLRMYLAISILFFLIVAALPLSNSGANGDSAAQVDVYPKLMFLLLPIFALFLQALFRQTFYLSNLVFAIHLHCLAYLAIALVIPLEAYEDQHAFFIYLQIPIVGYMLVYMLLALKRFYSESWFNTTWKLAALFLLYSIVMGLSFDYFLKIIVG